MRATLSRSAQRRRRERFREMIRAARDRYERFGPMTDAELDAYYNSPEGKADWHAGQRANREHREQLVEAAFRARADELAAMRPAATRAAPRARGAGRPAGRRASTSSTGDDSDQSDREPNADVEPDLRVALLSMLADGEHWIELRRRRPHGRWCKDWAPTPERADELAGRRILEVCDVYVGVLPRQGRELVRQCIYEPARALWTDLDTERAVRKLALFEPEPTAIVESGGLDGDTPKLHAYWALTGPLPAAEVRRHALRLAHHLEADTGACDSARILRVPGSRNHKTGRVARLVRFTGEVVDLDALTGNLGDAPDWQPDDEPKQAKTTDELVALFTGHYRDGEGRHDHGRSVIGVLLRYCDRLPPDVLLELADGWHRAHTHPYKGRAELERNFDNLLKRERTRRGLA
jgi:hypothetical protein